MNPPTAFLSLRLFLLKSIDCSNWDYSSLVILYIREIPLIATFILIKFLFQSFLYPLQIPLDCSVPSPCLRWVLWIENSFGLVLSWEFNWAESKRPLRNPFFDYQMIYVANAVDFYFILYFDSISFKVSNKLFASWFSRRPVNQCFCIDCELILLFIWLWQGHYPIWQL